MVVIVFRKLVVIGLVVGLGSCGLGCGSKTRYEERVSWPMACDLPDAPAEELYTRVKVPATPAVDASGAYIWSNHDFKWGESGEWTGIAAGDAPLHLCTQNALDRLNPTTTTKAKTTTTKASTVDIDRCRSAMEVVKRYLYTSDNEKFDAWFRRTLKDCGNRRTWQSVAREVGGSIDGMLTAACMLNGNTAVCKN